MADEQPETEVDQLAGPPRWVKVTGVVVAAVVVLFVVLHLIGSRERAARDRSSQPGPGPDVGGR